MFADILSTLGSDELLGEGGEDAMVGDNGVVISRVMLDASQFIRSNKPFLDDDIYIRGTLFSSYTSGQSRPLHVQSVGIVGSASADCGWR